MHDHNIHGSAPLNMSAVWTGLCLCWWTLLLTCPRSRSCSCCPLWTRGWPGGRSGSASLQPDPSLCSSGCLPSASCPLYQLQGNRRTQIHSAASLYTENTNIVASFCRSVVLRWRPPPRLVFHVVGCVCVTGPGLPSSSPDCLLTTCCSSWNQPLLYKRPPRPSRHGRIVQSRLWWPFNSQPWILV